MAKNKKKIKWGKYYSWVAGFTAGATAVIGRMAWNARDNLIANGQANIMALCFGIIVAIIILNHYWAWKAE